MRYLRYLLPALLILLASGCGVTKGLIYTVDIQQGNVLDQRLVDDLRPGMTKRQVTIVLGTPAIASPFHHDRWDYVAVYRHRGEQTSRTILSLSFENDRLVKMEGDYLPEASDLVGDAATEESS
jgi:outer membrane protein assembly factor BamE